MYVYIYIYIYIYIYMYVCIIRKVKTIMRILRYFFLNLNFKILIYIEIITSDIVLFVWITEILFILRHISYHMMYISYHMIDIETVLINLNQGTFKLIFSIVIFINNVIVSISIQRHII